jgi:hypothetical protein
MSIVSDRVPGGDGKGTGAESNGVWCSADVREHISGFEPLSELGIEFYPIRPDKSPAVKGRLERAMSNHPMKIQYWVERQHHRHFAIRIPRCCRLMVIDTEDPFKHGEPGPDGELVLGELLEEHSIDLPPCPTVQSATGGFHRYLLVPKGIRIHSSVALWPGVDILAAGSNVILPGSRVETGTYRMLRSFSECPIPEAPRALWKLIRAAQHGKTTRNRGQASSPIPDGDSAIVSRRQWGLLFRNPTFQSFWQRMGKAADTSDSAYEYHLAKACLCCGLDRRQTLSVIQRW